MKISMLKKIGNILLAVFYILGSLTILFPNELILPNSLGIVAMGIALLAIGIFGSPYFDIGVKNE